MKRRGSIERQLASQYYDRQETHWFVIPVVPKLLHLAPPLLDDRPEMLHRSFDIGWNIGEEAAHQPTKHPYSVMSRGVPAAASSEMRRTV